MGTTSNAANHHSFDQVDWLNDEDPRKVRQDEEEDDSWTREYDVDHEIESQERRWDSRLRRFHTYCRVMDACIVLSLWGCSLYYYILWFRAKHPSGTHLHLIVVLATVVLGLLYAARGSIGVFDCQKVITCGLLVVQLGLCVYLVLLRSHYVHPKHPGGALLFHLLAAVSGIAIASELIRLVLILWMQRRRTCRTALQEPLLEGVEWQMRQQEWASRTEEDPLWWSREEEDEESIISGRRSCP